MIKYLDFEPQRVELLFEVANPAPNNTAYHPLVEVSYWLVGPSIRGWKC
jgi:hypothetical protein